MMIMAWTATTSLTLSIYIYLLSEIGNERMYKLSMPYAAETIKSVIYFKLT